MEPNQGQYPIRGKMPCKKKMYVRSEGGRHRGVAAREVGAVFSHDSANCEGLVATSTVRASPKIHDSRRTFSSKKRLSQMGEMGFRVTTGGENNLDKRAKPR